MNITIRNLTVIFAMQFLPTLAFCEFKDASDYYERVAAARQEFSNRLNANHGKATEEQKAAWRKELYDPIKKSAAKVLAAAHVDEVDQLASLIPKHDAVKEPVDLDKDDKDAPLAKKDSKQETAKPEAAKPATGVSHESAKSVAASNGNRVKTTGAEGAEAAGANSISFSGGEVSRTPSSAEGNPAGSSGGAESISFGKSQ